MTPNKTIIINLSYLLIPLGIIAGVVYLVSRAMEVYPILINALQ